MILADVASWPTWNPAIRESFRDDELEVGSRFRFSTEIGTFKCRFTQVDGPHSLAWKGRVLALGERQRWILASTDAGTRVSVHAEMTGFAARLLRRRLSERLEAVVQSMPQLLRLEAEVRVAEAQENAARAAERGEGTSR